MKYCLKGVVMDLYKVRNELNMGIPLTSIKLRVTDYSRVSTDSKEQKNSLKNQVEHFDEMIKNNPEWTPAPAAGTPPSRRRGQGPGGSRRNP